MMSKLYFSHKPQLYLQAQTLESFPDVDTPAQDCSSCQYVSGVTHSERLSDKNGSDICCAYNRFG